MSLSRIVAVAVVGSALCSTAAHSAVVVSTGSPVTFNFATPATTGYEFFTITPGIVICSVLESVSGLGCSGQDAPDEGTIEIFDDLDGVGNRINLGNITWGDNSPVLAAVSGTLSVRPGLSNGFSMVYTASVGSIEVASPSVSFESRNGASVSVIGQQANAVPEGSSLALAIGALAVLAGVHRGRARG